MPLQACQLPRDTVHSITSRGRQSPSLPTAFWELLHPRICHLRKIQAVSGKVRVPLAFEMMSSGEGCFSFLFPGKAPHHLTCHVLGFMDPWRSADDHQAVGNVKLKFRTKKQNNKKKIRVKLLGQDLSSALLAGEFGSPFSGHLYHFFGAKPSSIPFISL